MHAGPTNSGQVRITAADRVRPSCSIVARRRRAKLCNCPTSGGQFKTGAIQLGINSQILPFCTLSKRLLLALGATWDERPYFKGIQPLRETCAVRRLVAPSWPEFTKLPKNDHAIRLLLIGGKRLMDACGPK